MMKNSVATISGFYCAHQSGKEMGFLTRVMRIRTTYSRRYMRLRIVSSLLAVQSLNLTKVLPIGLLSYSFVCYFFKSCLVKYPSIQEMTALIGSNVLRLRKEKGLSQSELCYRAEIDIATLSRIEGGKIKSSFSTYYKLGSALEVPMFRLFMDQ